MSLKSKAKLFDILKEIKADNFNEARKLHNIKVKAENALNFIYFVGLKRLTFTEEEKKEIGSLLVSAIEPIKFNIEYTACRCRTRMETILLVKRSAIQFLIDDYSHFPIQNSTLAEIFKEADIEESVEILDDLIEKWSDVSDSDEGSTDIEEEQALIIPSSHTWWKCKLNK